MHVIRMLQLSDELVPQLSLLIPLEIFFGLFWTGVFIFFALRLAQNKPYALRYTLGMVMLFVLYSLIRLVLFAQADYDAGRTPFLLVGTIVVLLILVLLLIRSRTSTSK